MVCDACFSDALGSVRLVRDGDRRCVLLVRFCEFCGFGVVTSSFGKDLD